MNHLYGLMIVSISSSTQIKVCPIHPYQSALILPANMDVTAYWYRKFQVPHHRRKCAMQWCLWVAPSQSHKLIIKLFWKEHAPFTHALRKQQCIWIYQNDTTSTWQTYLKLSIFYNKNVKVDNLMECVTPFAPVSHIKIHPEEEDNKFGKYILENEPRINLLGYNYQNASPSEVEGIVRKEISPLYSRQIKPLTILSWGNQQLVKNVASLQKEDNRKY